MQLFKKFVGAVIIASASFSLSATTTTAGGVVWDNSPTGGVSGMTEFQQWFSTNPFAAGVITSSTAAPPVVGNYLTGIGIISNLFNNRNYGEVLPFFQGSGYCETGTDCVLTFAFGGLKAGAFNTSLGGFEFDTSDAWLNIFFQSPINFSGVASPDFHTKYSQVANGTLWASFDFDKAILRGNALTGADGGVFEAFLSVTGGDATVVSLLDKHTGMPDIFLSGNAFIQSNGYSSEGNGQFRTIPTPTSIALLGLGILGLRLASRKKH